MQTFGFRCSRPWGLQIRMSFMHSLDDRFGLVPHSVDGSHVRRVGLGLGVCVLSLFFLLYVTEVDSMQTACSASGQGLLVAGLLSYPISSTPSTLCIGLCGSYTTFTAGLASSSMSYGAAGLDALYQAAMKQRTWRDIPADAMSKSQLRQLGQYRARMRDQQIATQTLIGQSIHRSNSFHEVFFQPQSNGIELCIHTLLVLLVLLLLLLLLLGSLLLVFCQLCLVYHCCHHCCCYFGDLSRWC